MSESEENLPESTMNVTVGHEVVANQSSRGLVPGFGGRISAALVWDGTDEVRIPAAMGTPREDQMRGTARERLVELSGRLCYDALGKGRSSPDYFEHILEVGHTSITEHAAFTAELVFDIDSDCVDAAVHLLNRPGVWVDWSSYSDHRVRVTLNPRVILDWRKHDTVLGSEKFNRGVHPKSQALGSVLNDLASGLVPSIVRSVVDPDIDEEYARVLGLEAAHVDEPERDEERWISLYLVGSRAWGNELVRHRMGAISQRSTRYVDEAQSEWVLHPLAARYFSEMSPSELGGDGDRSLMMSVLNDARAEYEAFGNELQAWLVSKGTDKTSARKQARGAARGVLGLSLETEIMYSASVSTWRHILSMRAADAADAEIRLGFAEAVLPSLRASRYGDRFADLELGPAGDGIGRSIKGGGHR